MSSPSPLPLQRLLSHPRLSRLAARLRHRRAVLLPLAAGGALLLAFALGRHSQGPPLPSPAAGPADGRPGRSAPAGESPGMPISEEQLRRYGLEVVWPELSRGSERPLAGFVEAAVGAQSSVEMPIAGQISRLLLEPGQPVRAGQGLALVSSPEAAALHADAQTAQAAALSLELQYRRMLPMGRQGALGWQEVENLRIAAVRARSAARAATARARAIGGPDGAGRLVLRSPIDGRVAAVKASAGAVLQAGEPVAEIRDARGSELRFLVSPLLGGTLQPGQSLRVKAGPRELRARVIAVAPEAMAEQRVMVVRAEASEGALPPAGTAVTAFVVVPSSERRYTLPPDAVQLRQGQAVVFRYSRGRVELRPVVIGRSSGGRIPILAGLRGDDPVLAGNTAVLVSMAESGAATGQR